MTPSKKAETGLRNTIETWVRGHADEMAALLEELVAIPTENPPGTNHLKCANAIERAMHDAGFLCERFASDIPHRDPADAPVCLMGAHGHGDAVFYFHGHYDVVPAQSPLQFVPRRQKHFLFGRGSCDMKGGVVAMLYALRALKECRVRLTGKVVLAVVPDEETGGARGSAWLAKNGLLGRGGIAMLTAEPTSGVVWHANRGAITLRVDVAGKSAHVGLQHQGENAFERMHLVVGRLLDLKREVEQRETAYQVSAPENVGGKRALKKPGPRHSILLIGGASGGGTNFNVVPERCWFTIDRRINPEEDLETEKNKLIAVLEGCRSDGIPLQWQFLQEAPSASSASDELVGRALASSVKAVTRAAPKFEMCPALLETRFYAARGVPAYAYGPGLLSVAHGPNEYVDLRRIADCAAIYALTAAEVLKG